MRVKLSGAAFSGLLSVLGMLLFPLPAARAGVDVGGGWQATSAGLTDAQLGAQLSGTFDGSNNDFLQLSHTFTNLQPFSILFTNTLTQANSNNNYAKFLFLNDSVMSNNDTLKTTWGGFVFAITDTYPQLKEPFQSPNNTDTHPELAHFHTPTGFISNPFGVISTIPLRKGDNGVQQVIATAADSSQYVYFGNDYMVNGLKLHDDPVYDTNGNPQNQFTLTLTPLPVPETSATLPFGLLILTTLLAGHSYRRRAARSGASAA